MTAEALTQAAGSGALPGAELVPTTLAALDTGTTRVVEIPARPGVTAAWPQWSDPVVVAALERDGIPAPWLHQVEAAESARAGQHTVLATGTASGKSVAYWLPALTAIRESGATVLYCTPTKALAQDQLSRLNALGLPDLVAACYDGDTPQELRPWVRRSASFVLTNPDMLHHSILPGHARWTPFLRRLRYVILDEGHTYRGVFGSHMAAVVRRLRRVVAVLGGAAPTFIVTSATLARPELTAAHLVGEPVSAVTTDTSRSGATTVILHDPDPSERGAFATTADALAGWTGAGARSLGFIRSRSGAESLARAVADRLPPPDRRQVQPYRGGLLPEERRHIESALRDGSLRCVATTNALELGVDISGLDAVALCGWPGTRASFLQQVGRAGRQGAPAAALLVAQQDPLDQFYVNDPERILGPGVESAVFDPDNPYVLLPHVAASVAEAPMTTAESREHFGPGGPEALAALAARGFVRQRGERWFWVARERAAGLTDLRGAGRTVSIVEPATGRVLGTVDDASAPAQVHTGAVYTHLGRTYLVDELDLEGSVALVHPDEPGYTTVAQSVSDVAIVATRATSAAGLGSVSFGDVAVGAQVVGFLRRQVGTGTVLGSEPLDLPRRQLHTRAVWWTVPEPALRAAHIPEHLVPGAVHAAEHAAIGVLPALATCDRWDIGGLSTRFHPDTGTATVFVYDGHAGGAGFARRGFDAAQEWLRATRDVIVTCSCPTGCPGCVVSPKCGNGNEPLHKESAVALLSVLLDGPDPDQP